MPWYSVNTSIMIQRKSTPGVKQVWPADDSAGRGVQIVPLYKWYKHLVTAFSRLKYPIHLVNSTVKSFVDSKVCDQQQPLSPVVLPFKDQISADMYVCMMKEKLKDLNLKVNTTIEPVFARRKIEQELNVKEEKPPIITEQCVVYNFQCDLCDAGYVGYTCGHLHNRVKGHKQQSSAIPPLQTITRTCTGRSDQRQFSLNIDNCKYTSVPQERHFSSGNSL